MIITFLILMGFRSAITDKIYSFASHLQVTKYTLGGYYEEVPVSLNSHFYQNYNQLDFIDHVQEYVHKAGLIKTDEEVQGVVFKGVGRNYDQKRFGKYLEQGRFIKFNDSTYSKEIIISKKLSDKLRLNLGDDLIMYFIQQPVRFRKLNISGIYNTRLEDFDDKILIGDIALIRRLNNWADTLAGGFEVFIKNPNQLEMAQERLFMEVDSDLFVDKVSDIYRQFFDWLALINRNVYIFLTLVLFVACFNMLSILFILIMERTQMIGMLKALGSSDQQIRRIFIYNGTWITLKGMLWGNIIGIGLGWLQYHFKIIPLDPENYYMSYVPIEWNIPLIIILNLGILVAVHLVLLIPAMFISRLKPVDAIRFD